MIAFLYIFSNSLVNLKMYTFNLVYYNTFLKFKIKEKSKYIKMAYPIFTHIA
jgi:hypothetical protein